MLLVPLFLLLIQIFIQFLYLLCFCCKSLVRRFRKIIDIGIELIFGLGKFVIEFVLESQEGVIGTFGLIGDKLLAILNFPMSMAAYLSIS